MTRTASSAAVRYLVDAIDRDLFLSDQQRLQLTESLSSHWDQSWSTTLEYRLYGNQFYPTGFDPYVTPFLDANQKKAWQGHQSMAIGGFFGMVGGFVNDNDALEVELGEVRKAEPARACRSAASNFGKPQCQRPSPKEAVTKEVATKE